MIERSHSFSRNGIQLDVNLHSAMKPKDQQAVQKVLNSRASALINTVKLRPRPPSQQGTIISKLISRQVPSSFQKCHTPVQNINAIYNQKVQLTKKRNKYYSMKKFTPTSYFQTVAQLYKKQHDEQESQACGKLLKTMNSKRWIRTQSQSGLRNSNYNTIIKSRSKLLIPFDKQTQRPFYQTLKKLQAEAILKPKPTDEADKVRDSLQKKQKLKKTHRFESYQKHDFLNPQKVAAFSSQMNVHEVSLKNFKQKKQQSHMKFDKFVNQVKTRYDRDCTPWLVKLSYDSRDQITRGLKQMRKFSKQTSRKLNQVHSKYPIRLAM